MKEQDLKIDLVPGTDYKIYQDRKKFSYGTDAIFLSDFIKTKKTLVDLGTGTGIIPLRVYKEGMKIYGLEIQKEVAEMAQASVDLNGLTGSIEILNMDLRQVEEVLGRSSIDTVVSNPPYMRAEGALVNEDENFALSRHEITCKLEDIIRVANYLLSPLGDFYMVHRPDRLVDIFYLMRKYQIEPKYIRLVQAKEGKKPNLLLVHGRKQAKIDLKFLDPLIVYKEDGSYTDEIMRIYYGGYKNV